MQQTRKNIRLVGYDYSQNGFYFVTICTQNRENLFGYVVDGKMILNEFGMIVDTKINELKKYNNVDIDIYRVMPNHVHLILIIVGAGPRACPDNPRVRPIYDGNILSGSTQGSHIGSTQGSTPTKLTPTVGEYVKRLKTLTTRIYIENVKYNNWPSFDKRLWQRNYYERIIRNEEEYLKIKKYIKSTPIMWERDRNNPKNIL